MYSINYYKLKLTFRINHSVVHRAKNNLIFKKYRRSEYDYGICMRTEPSHAHFELRMCASVQYVYRRVMYVRARSQWTSGRLAYSANQLDEWSSRMKTSTFLGLLYTVKVGLSWIRTVHGMSHGAMYACRQIATAGSINYADMCKCTRTSFICWKLD